MLWLHSNFFIALPYNQVLDFGCEELIALLNKPDRAKIYRFLSGIAANGRAGLATNYRHCISEKLGLLF